MHTPSLGGATEWLNFEPLGPAEPGAEAYRGHVRVAEVDDWVPVEVAGGEAEAELLCSVLRGAGIECLPRLTNSGAGAGDGLGTVGAHDIMVSPQDAQDAREILHEPR